ncbi:MAG: hypothetical protein ABIE70_00085 [bacterium]
MDSKKHPSRSALIKAARDGSTLFASHLQGCQSCRLLFEMSRQLDAANQEPLQQSSAVLAARIRAIPLLQATRRILDRVTGRATADSWSQLPAMALRDGSAGLERRLVLQADDVRLELVAERTVDDWEFVARIYEHNKVADQYVLKAGSRTVVPREEGFYHWSATRPPKTIRLLGQKLQLDFEKLSWTSAMTS